MRFSWQEYWGRLPFPPLGHLPYLGIKSASPALVNGFFTTEPPGKTQQREMGTQAPPGDGRVSSGSTVALSGGAGAVSPPGPSSPLGVPHLTLHSREDQRENVHGSFLN